MKKTITVILLLTTLTLVAQTTSKMYVIENSAKILRDELISKDIRDKNGEVCAGVEIITDLDGLSFDSYNGVVKVNSKPGRNFVFVSPSERVVEVFKSGYEPLKIILNDFGINLKSGTTWQIKITGDKKTKILPVNIILNPKIAEIFIDNIKQEDGSTYQLPEGKHIVKVMLNGYKQVIDTINVSLHNSLFNYSLEKITLEKVTIKSIPQGADVFIDNINRGKTDKQFFNYPGKYKITLSKVGYFQIDTVLSVSEAVQNIFTFNLINNTAVLSISTNPADAELYINEEKVVKRQLEYPPGSYKIEIKKNGFETIEDVITIVKGEPISKKYNLTPITGSLQLTITPIESEVKLSRGNKVISSWSGSKIIDSLMIGEYQLNINSKGYESKSKTINIKEAEATVEDVSLIGGDGFIEDFISSVKSVSPIIKLPEMIINTERKEVKITYKLDGDKEKKYDVTLNLKSKISSNFDFVANNITGDYEEVTTSDNYKTITWDFSSQVSNYTQQKYYIEISTEESSGSTWYYWVGGAIVAGGAAAAAILLSPTETPTDSPSGSIGSTPPGRP